jgi:outer membrane protein assembly factor BamB
MRLTPARIGTFVAICGLTAAVTASSATAAPMHTSVTARAAATSSINWAQDGFNKGQTGYNAFETAIGASNVGSLTYRFSIVSPVAKDSCSQQGPPIVDNGRLFISDQGGFGAYNPTTGAPLWNVREPGDPQENITPLLVASGNTVIAVETDCISQSDPPSEMTAYNATTGAPLWSVNSDPAIFSLVIDGNVVVTSGAPAEGPETAGYNLATGAQIWANSDDAADVALSAGGTMLLTNFDGSGSTAINVATGATKWTTTKVWTEFASSKDGTKIAATSGNDVVYLNAVTGAVLWTATGIGAYCRALVGCAFAAIDATHIYIAAGATLTALNTSNGHVAWHVTVNSFLDRPVVANGVVYVPQTGDAMDLFKASTGAQLDGSQYVGEINHAVVVNGFLYVTNGRVMDAFTP